MPNLQPIARTRVSAPVVAPEANAVPEDEPRASARDHEDAAATQIHRMTSVSSPRRANRAQRLDRAMRRVVAHYQHDATDTAGLIRLLRDPSVGRAVAGASEDEIAASLGRVDPGLLHTLERRGVVGALHTAFDASIRGDIVARGDGLIQRRRAALSRLQADVLGDLPRFQNAPAGTPEHALARRLGILGDAGDAARVRETMSEALDGLDRLQDWLHGGTWENGDLQGSAMAAASRRRWEMTGADAIIQDSLLGGHDVDAGAHRAIEASEAGELGVELYEVAEASHAGAAAGAAAALPLAVAVAGLGFGLYMHHLGEEQLEEHIAAAHELGL